MGLEAGAGKEALLDLKFFWRRRGVNGQGSGRVAGGQDVAEVHRSRKLRPGV
jgi:hypothetical protein